MSFFLFNPVGILILINTAVYFLPYVINFGNRAWTSQQQFLLWGWKENNAIRDGEFYRLLSSTFLHGDLLHLLSNMYALWIFGAGLANFSPVIFLAVYFASGIAGSFASFLFNPSPSVGASGAIFGLVGFLLAQGIRESRVGNGGEFISNLLVYIVISFAIAMIPNSRIDIWGHLGGLIAGFVIGYIVLLN